MNQNQNQVASNATTSAAVPSLGQRIAAANTRACGWISAVAILAIVIVGALCVGALTFSEVRSVDHINRIADQSARSAVKADHPIKSLFGWEPSAEEVSAARVNR